jgi:hypothetical protein
MDITIYLKDQDAVNDLLDEIEYVRNCSFTAYNKKRGVKKKFSPEPEKMQTLMSLTRDNFQVNSEKAWVIEVKKEVLKEKIIEESEYLHDWGGFVWLKRKSNEAHIGLDSDRASSLMHFYCVEHLIKVV